jgi:hypothetical protein
VASRGAVVRRCLDRAGGVGRRARGLPRAAARADQAPIRWPDLGPDAANDDVVVRRCQEEVRAAMQASMDEMVAEGGFGVRARIAEALAR